MTLAEQIDALMADHKSKTAREFDLLQRLDSTLLHADIQIEANIRRIVTAHEERRATVGELLNDLHHMMVGSRAYDQIPPLEDRFVDADRIGEASRIKQRVGQIMDQVDGVFNGMH